jgi:hypothetical protein
VSTAPADAATPSPAGSPWYTVQDPPRPEEAALEEGLGVAEAAAPADPPAVTQSAAVRPASAPAVRTAGLLRIVTD